MLGYQKDRHYSNPLLGWISQFDTISTEIESKYDENEGIRLSRRRGKEVLALRNRSIDSAPRL